MSRQTTREAKGVKTKINPKNIVYNAPIEEIKKIVPFEVGSKTMESRLKFLVKSTEFLVKLATEDKEGQKIAEDTIKTLVDSTVAVLDKEYEFKALSGIQQKMDDYFSERFIPYCLPIPNVYDEGNPDLIKVDVDTPNHVYDSVGELCEKTKCDTSDKTISKLCKKKPVSTKYLNLLSKKEAETPVESDFTDELKSKKPKVSNTGLANEQCSFYGTNAGGGTSDTDLIFNKLYEILNRKLDRIKNGTNGELIKGTQYWTPKRTPKRTPKLKKEGVLKLNKKEYTVDIGKFEKYEPVRDAFGRFASKTLMSKKSSNRKKKATGKKVIKSKK